MLGGVADVRDQVSVQRVLDDGVAELGGVDIVCGNAGISGSLRAVELDEDIWREMLDINLTGVWHTVKAALPHLLGQGRGGSIVLTSSVAGVHGWPGLTHYVSAKHGVLGMMRSLSNELSPEFIRVNAVLPGNVGTPMLLNESLYRCFLPDKEHPTQDEFAAASQQLHTIPIPWLDPIDITNAVLFLASDDARYVTGSTLTVDAGMSQK